MTECYKRHEVAPGVHQDIPHTSCLRAAQEPPGIQFFYQFGEGWKTLDEDAILRLLGNAYPGMVRRVT